MDRQPTRRCRQLGKCPQTVFNLVLYTLLAWPGSLHGRAHIHKATLARHFTSGCVFTIRRQKGRGQSRERIMHASLSFYRLPRFTFFLNSFFLFFSSLPPLCTARYLCYRTTSRRTSAVATWAGTAKLFKTRVCIGKSKGHVTNKLAAATVGVEIWNLNNLNRRRRRQKEKIDSCLHI